MRTCPGCPPTRERSPRAADRGDNPELGNDTDLDDELDELDDGLDEDAFYREAAAELDDVGDLREVYPPERAAALRMLDELDGSGGRDHRSATTTIPRSPSAELSAEPPPTPQPSRVPEADAVAVAARPEPCPLSRDAEQTAGDGATSRGIEFANDDEAAEADDAAADAADDAAGNDDVPWVGQRQPSIAETAAAVERAHEALTRLARARSAHTQDAADRARTEQLSRWHTDDHELAASEDRALEGSTR